MTNTETQERCKRCRSKLENHATAVVDRQRRVFICPSTKGHAPSYEKTMGTQRA
jgi:hypothetical protein